MAGSSSRAFLGPWFLAALSALLAAAPAPYTAGPWIEVTTPNFRLISNAGEATTRRVAERLEQFRAMAAILTGARKVESTLPVRVFVFGDRDSWSHFQARADVAGYFVRDAEANLIALDASRADAGGLETVFHEYVHLLSRNRNSRVHPPTWYEEGFADAISTARIEDGKIVVGADPGRAVLLEREKWLPLERVVTARGYAGLDADEMSLFYAQSWLLVHRLTWGHVAGLAPRHQEVIAYIQRVANGEPEEATFRATLGTSFAAMDEELREYLRKPPPRIVLDEAPPAFDFEPSVRPIAAATALVALGELQLARGEEGAAEAEALARQALESEPQSRRAPLVLGAALALQGKDPGRELTARVLALAPDDPAIVRGVAFVDLLQLQKLTLPGPQRSALAVEARDLYARAIELAPDSAAAHAGLGYARLALNQPAEAAQALQRAFLLDRSDLGVVLALGELHSRYGRPEDARRLLQEVVGSAHDEKMRVRARELLDAMAAPAGG